MSSPPPTAASHPFGQAPEQRYSRVLFDEHWQGAGDSLADPGNARRVAQIASLCPQVESVLDVGCGNGDVLRALRDKARRRTGCETSTAGLLALRAAEPASAPTVIKAAADHLPFADRAFELVTCCDVLEHLPDAIAPRCLHELMRVSSAYVLINVPVREDLGWSTLRCSECGTRYHRDHHQRSYSNRMVEEILPAASFAPVAVRTTGWTVRRAFDLPGNLGPLLGVGHDQAARCERCGAPPAPLSRARRLLRDTFVFLHNALTRPLSATLSRDTEIVALFRRRLP